VVAERRLPTFSSVLVIVSRVARSLRRTVLLSVWSGESVGCQEFVRRSNRCVRVDFRWCKLAKFDQ